MKYIFFLIFITTLFCNAQTKHAFLVGIGNYEKANLGWKNIDGDTDISEYIKPFLIENGFKKKDVDTLINEQATRQNVGRRLEHLVKRINKDDLVFIYFATHGQQITDLDRDEIHDNLDESIVLYDTPICENIEDYKGGKHLIDDDIKTYLHKIRDAVGNKGQVFMAVDACFSGDLDRLLIRPENPDLVRRGSDDFCNINISNNIETRGSDENELGELEYSSATISPLILLTASKSNEINFQLKGEKIGSLTFALTRFLSTKTSAKENIDYKNFLVQIKEAYKHINFKNGSGRKQTPTCKQCNSEEQLNTFFNNSRIVTRKGYFLRNNFKTNDTYHKWNYGKLHGFSKGTIFEVKTTKDSLIGYAKILSANALNSWFYLNEDKDPKLLSNCIFTPKKLNYIAEAFTIDINPKYHKIVDSVLTIKNSKELHKNSSRYRLEIEGKSYNIFKDNTLFIGDRSIESLESILIYLSYVKYLNELNTISHKKFSENNEVDYSLNDKIKIKKISNKYFLNDGYGRFSNGFYFTIFNTNPFKLTYPNRSTSYYDAFINKEKRRIYFTDETITEYHLIIIENNYDLILDLSRCIFNHSYFDLTFNNSFIATPTFQDSESFDGDLPQDNLIDGFYLFTDNTLD